MSLSKADRFPLLACSTSSVNRVSEACEPVALYVDEFISKNQLVYPLLRTMFQAIGCIILAQDNLVYFCYASICFPPCGKPSVCKDAAAPEMVYN
jgi:hypothetical protein